MQRMAYYVNEASSITGWSRSKLYDMMKIGDLPSVKAGGRRMILHSDLEDYFISLRSRVAK